MVSPLNICHLSNYFPPACHVHLSKQPCSKLPTASCPTKSDLGCGWVGVGGYLDVIFVVKIIVQNSGFCFFEPEYV